jgi:hypothetical protein
MRWKADLTILGLGLCVAHGFMPSPGWAEDSEKVSLPDGTAASISDMSWLSGTWETPFGEGLLLEESWTAPRAQMLGAFLR